MAAKPKMSLIFGVGPKKPAGDEPDGDEEYGAEDGGGEDLADARDLLQKLAGFDDETMDALHEYIRACSM